MTDVHLPQRHETTMLTDRDVARSNEPLTRSGPELLCDRLGVLYPDADPAILEMLVRDAWTESSRFRIKDFRMVLVERAVRAHLGAQITRMT